MSAKYRRPLTIISNWVTTSKALTDFTTHRRAASAGFSQPGSAATIRRLALRKGIVSLPVARSSSLASILARRPSERCRSTSCVNTEKCDCRLSSIHSATKALKCSEKRAMRTPASTIPSTVMPSTCSSSGALGGTTLHRTETAGTRTASAWTARSNLCPRREGVHTQTSGFASHNGIPRATSALAPMKTRSSLPACCTANNRARDTASQTAHRELRN